MKTFRVVLTHCAAAAFMGLIYASMMDRQGWDFALGVAVYFASIPVVYFIAAIPSFYEDYLTWRIRREIRRGRP